MRKIWLDDERPAPEGWIRCRWPEEVIELLKAGGPGGDDETVLSLDHDLGESGAMARTGYDVLLWIEQRVAESDVWTPPGLIQIHSQNMPARKRMLAAVSQIRHLARRST